MGAALGVSRFKVHLLSIAVLKNYCAKKDIRNDVLHQVDMVVNAIPSVEELTCITQRNSRTAITGAPCVRPRLIGADAPGFSGARCADWLLQCGLLCSGGRGMRTRVLLHGGASRERDTNGGDQAE